MSRRRAAGRCQRVNHAITALQAERSALLQALVALELDQDHPGREVLMQELRMEFDEVSDAIVLLLSMADPSLNSVDLRRAS